MYVMTSHMWFVGCSDLQKHMYRHILTSIEIGELRPDFLGEHVLLGTHLNSYFFVREPLESRHGSRNLLKPPHPKPSRFVPEMHILNTICHLSALLYEYTLNHAIIRYMYKQPDCVEGEYRYFDLI